MTSRSFAKTRISPSDLTFGWNTCKRCFWMRYAHDVAHKGTFPGVVLSLSNRQEKWYKDKHSHEFSPTLPSGVVDSTGKMLESSPILVNGEETPFTLGGKYDFLLRYDSGTWGIIDTKVSSSADKAEFYWPQLAAYDHILANPKSGEPRRCETLGVLVWAIGNASHHEADEYRVGFNATYEPVEVDPTRFDAFIADVVTVLMGEMPERGEKCENCNFFEKRSQLTAP